MEIEMLQVTLTRQKSRAKKGWASWVVDTRYVLADGKQSYHQTREDAQNYIDKLNKETTVHSRSVDSWKWSFYELAKSYISFVEKEYHAGDRSKSYYEEKVRYVDCFLDCIVDGKPIADMRVSDLSAGMVADEIMDQLKVNRSKKTVANILGGVGKMIKFGIIKSCRSTNPLEDVEIKGEKKPKSKDKAERIADDVIEAIIDNMNPRWQLITNFAADTGVRQGEQRALTWGQINFDKCKVTIDRALKHKTTTAGGTKTKAGKRTIPLTRDVLAQLKELYIQQGRPNDPERLVFGTEFNHPITSAKYLKRIREACKRAGVAPIRWHDLRHYYASVLLQIYGDDLWRIKNYMGHASIRITEDIYGHWLEDDRDNDEAVDKITERKRRRSSR